MTIEERREEIAEKLTVKNIVDLQKRIKKEAKPIGDWKKIVKEFAIKYNLSDMTAIDVANKRILI